MVPHILKKSKTIEMVGIPTWGHILPIGLGHNIIHGQNQHQIKKRMTDYIKEPNTTIFTGPTGCGKTHLVLDLIEKEYNKDFDYIIIISPTLKWNKTYHSRNWIKNDDKVWVVEPKDIIRLRCNKIVPEKVNGLYY